MTPLVLTQGASLRHKILLTSKPVSILGSTGGNGVSFQTSEPHCLNPGDNIVLSHNMGSCIELPVCGTVTQVPNDTTINTNLVTDVIASGDANGFLGKALDLEGIRLVGSIASRSGAGRESTVVGATAEGCLDYPQDVLVRGAIDFAPGDLITIANTSIFNARVEAVFFVNQTPSPTTATKTRCGCRTKPLAENAIAAPTSAVLRLENPHNENFMDAPVSRTGGTLLDFSFEYYQNDPTCGIVVLTIGGTETRELGKTVPDSGCGSEAYKIGCYTIGLVRGYSAITPSHYPAGEYNSDVLLVQSGIAYLRPVDIRF